MYNLTNIIGIFHLCGMIIENIYGLISFENNLFDKIYIISYVSIPLSWLICKDECIISYAIKKYENSIRI